MSKLLVVIGVTGLQGGSVARLFQNMPGWRVRGITRDPSKASNASLREAGVELVAADFDDPSALDRAFEGATAIFAVTDFWQFLQQLATFAEAARSGRLPNQVAMDREIQQGRNIIDVATNYMEGLDRLVLSTLSDSQKWSQGAIKWNLHFDGYLSRARSQDKNPLFAPQKQADGSFIFYDVAVPNGKPIPYVDPANDTGYFVKALMDAPAGTTMLGYGEQMLPEEYLALWSKVNGVRARYESLTVEVGKTAGLPEFLVQEVIDAVTYVSTYEWAGGDPEVKHPGDLGVNVSKLSKVEDYIKADDWSSVL